MRQEGREQEEKQEPCKADRSALPFPAGMAAPYISPSRRSARTDSVYDLDGRGISSFASSDRLRTCSSTRTIRSIRWFRREDHCSLTMLHPRFPLPLWRVTSEVPIRILDLPRGGAIDERNVREIIILTVFDFYGESHSRVHVNLAVKARLTA